MLGVMGRKQTGELLFSVTSLQGEILYSIPVFSILRFIAGYDNGGQGKLIEVKKSGVEYEEFLEQMEGA